MYAQTIDGVWFDVGQPFELIKAQSTLMSRYDELPSPTPKGSLRADGVLMAQSVECQGVVDNAVLGPTARSVRPPRCQPPSHERVPSRQGCSSRSLVLGVGVVVPSNCIVENCVIGDGAVLNSERRYVGEKVEHFMSVVQDPM